MAFALKNWKVKLPAGIKTLTERKSIFLGFCRESSVNFLNIHLSNIITTTKVMMLLKFILKKFTDDWKFTKSLEKINPLVYVGDITVYVKKMNGNSDISNKNNI